MRPLLTTVSLPSASVMPPAIVPALVMASAPLPAVTVIVVAPAVASVCPAATASVPPSSAMVPTPKLPE